MAGTNVPFLWVKSFKLKEDFEPGSVVELHLDYIFVDNEQWFRVDSFLPLFATPEAAKKTLQELMPSYLKSCSYETLTGEVLTGLFLKSLGLAIYLTEHHGGYKLWELTLLFENPILSNGLNLTDLLWEGSSSSLSSSSPRPVDEECPIVMDCGSSFCKVGFLGEHEPRSVSPCVTGRTRHSGVMVGMGELAPPVAEHALERAMDGSVELKFPIQKGLVTNWDDMEYVWHHAFYHSLRVSPEEHPLICTEVVFNPKANREKMVQIVFETFNMPALCVVAQPLLSLISFQARTGLILECGAGATYTVAIYEGYIMYHTILQQDLSGHDITNYLKELLLERKYDVSDLDLATLHQVKSRLCYVALDYQAECQNKEESVPCKLGNGRSIRIEKERFRCMEPMFQPVILNKESKSLHELMYNSLMKCDGDIRKELYSAVYASGGTTMCRGFAQRLEKELKLLVPQALSYHLRVRCKHEHSAWVGASIFLTKSCNLLNMCVTKEEYDEMGPAQTVELIDQRIKLI
eukprot:Lithocolla_globosa_v1_NODE_1494_length_2537_cov_4.841257.p1 type:complete len:520 gc:universal NODE_1494_length_2537_cov_4.841257:863-2422(+)